MHVVNYELDIEDLVGAIIAKLNRENPDWLLKSGPSNTNNPAIKGIHSDCNTSTSYYTMAKAASNAYQTRSEWYVFKGVFQTILHRWKL